SRSPGARRGSGCSAGRPDRGSRRPPMAGRAARPARAAAAAATTASLRNAARRCRTVPRTAPRTSAPCCPPPFGVDRRAKTAEDVQQPGIVAAIAQAREPVRLDGAAGQGGLGTDAGKGGIVDEGKEPGGDGVVGPGGRDAALWSGHACTLAVGARRRCAGAPPPRVAARV